MSSNGDSYKQNFLYWAAQTICKNCDCPLAISVIRECLKCLITTQTVIPARRRTIRGLFRWKRKSRVYLGHEGAVVVPGVVVPSVPALDDRPVGATDRRRWQSGRQWVKRRRRGQWRAVGGVGQIGAFEPRINYLRIIHVVHLTLGINPSAIGLDLVG